MTNWKLLNVKVSDCSNVKVDYNLFIQKMYNTINTNYSLVEMIHSFYTEQILESSNAQKQEVP